MGSNTHSRTAELTAVIRAWHFLYGERPLVLEDPFAIDLLSPELRDRCLNPDGQNTPGQGGSLAIVLGRARYTEDKLEESVRTGTDQYVMLGAGGDSFALRRPDLMSKIRAYEIDRTETQKWKQQRLTERGHELPVSLEFIPADLEFETVLEALDRSSFRRDRRAFFSWLGTTVYLTPDAIFRTLRSLAGDLVSGTEVIFDYRVQTEFIDPAEVDFVLAGDRATAEMGEPKHSFFNPYTFPDDIKATGFDMVENISPEQLTQRYFSDRKDMARPTTHHWYARIRLSG
ncbi:class I SAM-dependent methyltransferase [Chloroflexota bacterium]